MSPDFHRAYPIADWFLMSATDVRSSYTLQVAMTEFEYQGSSSTTWVSAGATT